MSDLVERLRHLVRLNEPQHGGPYAGHAAAACIKAMTESADELARLRSEVERLTRERDEALELAMAYWRTYEAATDKLTTLTARTREVLAPFAAVANAYSDREDDKFETWRDCHEPITREASKLLHFRAANTLFNELKEKDNG